MFGMISVEKNMIKLPLIFFSFYKVNSIFSTVFQVNSLDSQITCCHTWFVYYYMSHRQFIILSSSLWQKNQSDAWMFHLLVYHFAIPLSYYKFCKVLIHILLFLNEGRAIFSWFWTPLPPLLFLKEGVNFDSIPSRGEGSQKLKRGWKYGAGAGLLKGGWGWHFSYWVFPRFIIFTFRNYFTLCKILSYIWGKIIFFCHHNFRKKGHSKVSRNEPENIP